MKQNSSALQKLLNGVRVTQLCQTGKLHNPAVHFVDVWHEKYAGDNFFMVQSHELEERDVRRPVTLVKQSSVLTFKV